MAAKRLVFSALKRNPLGANSHRMENLTPHPSRAFATTRLKELKLRLALDDSAASPEKQQRGASTVPVPDEPLSEEIAAKSPFLRVLSPMVLVTSMILECIFL